jgi:hypothetical protein
MEGQPLFGNNFRVLIDGVEVGISEVSPLTSEGEPGEGGHRTVVLRRALTGSPELFRWREEAHTGKPATRRVSIHLYDQTGERPVIAWEFQGAWPSRYTVPSLDAKGNDVAMEELELAYERLIWSDHTEEAPAT